ncbi:MAG TPA: hypothetical protein VMW69_02225, partial [Spirochaetia bacterium]|nr:hypothetical protein [Spirochaetia bacterium]
MVARDEGLETRLRSAGVAYERMETNGGWAVVVPELGAKLLGAGIDSENAFWLPQALRPGHWLAGGQRTWIAPEMGSNSLYFHEGIWEPPASMDP